MILRNIIRIIKSPRHIRSVTQTHYQNHFYEMSQARDLK